MSDESGAVAPYADDVPLMGPDAPDIEKTSDLIRYLLTVRKRFGNTAITCSLQWGGSALNARSRDKAEVARLQSEVRGLRERLEIDHVYVNGERVEPPEGMRVPDGIECRDETIKLQAEWLVRYEAEVARLREALGKVPDGYKLVPLNLIPLEAPVNISKCLLAGRLARVEWTTKEDAVCVFIEGIQLTGWKYNKERYVQDCQSFVDGWNRAAEAMKRALLTAPVSAALKEPSDGN